MFLAEIPRFALAEYPREDVQWKTRNRRVSAWTELARQLSESVPQNLKVLGQDLERNFKTLLQSGIERMELVSREEFDLQRAVLERTRAKLEQMEARLGDLEKHLSKS